MGRTACIAHDMGDLTRGVLEGYSPFRSRSDQRDSGPVVGVP